MHVNLERRALVAFGMLWLGGARAFAAIDLTGIWSAEVRSRGGLGPQMIFTAVDATSTFGALVDFKYEIQGTLLKLSLMDPHGPTPPDAITQEFKIEGDSMTVMIAGGQRLVMTRVGAPHRDAHPIVGDWTYMHQTGIPALQRFSRNGITQLSV